MKLYFKLFVVFSLASIYSVAQQNYSFRVFATSGVAEIKASDSWKPLKSGASLFDADEIRVNENAYVGLVHVSGRSKEIRKGGTYKVKALASTITVQPSVLNKYVDFILSKNSDDAKKNRLVAVGSVTRSSFSHDILVYLPENQYADILNNKAIVNWESKSDAPGPFVVTVLNMISEELLVIETTNPSVSLDFNRPELKNDSYFLVQVVNKNNRSLSSDQYLIKKLPKSEQKKFSDERESVTRVMTEESALNNIIIAGYYETNHLLIDAIVAYEEAMLLAPGVAMYKDVYEEFLLRNRLKFPRQ
jgi:hypothetical protein